MSPDKSIVDSVSKCPVRFAVSILEGKWTLLIIKELLTETKRFGELLTALEGISPRILAQRLKFLEEHLIVTKTVYPVVPLKTEYSLVEPDRIRPLIDALAQWGSSLTHQNKVGK